MASRSVISLLGHCTTPEAKVLPDGTDLVSFSIATNTWSKEGDITNWWRVSVFGKRCKGLMTLIDRGLFTKGMLVAVVGEVSQRPYTAKDGTERVSMDVRAYDADICFPPKGQQDNITNITNYGEDSQDMDGVPF